MAPENLELSVSLYKITGHPDIFYHQVQIKTSIMPVKTKVSGLIDVVSPQSTVQKGKKGESLSAS